jgi:glutathione S-transferase
LAPPVAPLTRPVLVGRSSSHFTRIARIFAAELGVAHDYEVVRDLLSLERDAYGGNPALRLPILRTQAGDWFGALNISRELWRRSGQRLSITWPEDLSAPLLANAQELASQAMANEVTLIMAKRTEIDDANAYVSKLRLGLANTVAWLDAQLEGIVAALPARELSYLEVTLFCLFSHLEFREVLPIASYANLNRFCAGFGQRASARATPFRMD